MGAMPDSEMIAQVLGQTFEDAAFIFLEPVEEPPEWESDRVQVAMSYEGPGGSGKLLLTASHLFACKLAANLLGVDEDDEMLDAKADGALSEMLNIYAGAFVVELFGSEAVVQLGIPETKRLGDSETAPGIEGEHACGISLLTDEGDRIDAHAYCQ